MKQFIRQRVVPAALLLIACTFLCGCGFSYVIHSANQLDRADAKEFTLDKTEVPLITKAEIHTRIADVEFIQADSFAVEINYLYWDREPDYEMKDGKLYFDDSDSFPDSYSLNFNLHNTIKVYLPKDSAMEFVSIEDSSGDVDITGFVAEDLDVTVSYGDLTIKAAAASTADIILSSGTSKISDFNVGKLDFTNSYGDAKFTNINTANFSLPGGAENEECSINMSSGSVDIDGMYSSTIDVRNSYGDVTCDKFQADTAEFNLSSGDLLMKQGNLQKVEVEDSYGDVTLKLPGPASDYALDLDTSYGKLRVDGNSYEEHVKLNENGSKSIKANLSSGDVTVDFE
jgi:HSP20 family molecular chaperone IbpA